MSNNNAPNDIMAMAKFMNESNEAAIAADRLQDDRLGRQLRVLKATGDGSHDGAFHALEMLILRYGNSKLVPDKLYSDIILDGDRLDSLVIELKIAKKHPEFEITKDPVIIQKQYHQIKRRWNGKVSHAIRAAEVSTKNSNAMYSGIQMIAAHKALEETKKKNNDDLGGVVP